MLLDQLKILKTINWDNLIILDACRYDYFAKLWKLRQYEVYKALSPASWTLEWLSIIFDKPYPNTIIYSSNPYINKLKTDICINGICWRAYDKFEKIVEVWKYAWDKKLMTVPPWSLYKIVLMSLKFNQKKTKKKRNIIWFLQPHYPYIHEIFIKMQSTLINKINKKDFLTGDLDIIIRNILNIIIRNNEYILNEMYIKNLQLALNYVYKLIDRLNGTTIITADHGEHLGENVINALMFTIINTALSSFNKKYAKIIMRNKILQFKYIIKNYFFRNNILNNSRYIYKMKVYFHPPILASNELRHVPLVIIQK